MNRVNLNREMRSSSVPYDAEISPDLVTKATEKIMPEVAAWQNRSLEQRLAALEHGIRAVACSSGMAAVTQSLLIILQAGDEEIASAELFGGTIDLFGDLSKLGITTKYVIIITVEELEPLITDKTRMVFAELIGNAGLDIVDIRRVVACCHKRMNPLLSELEQTYAVQAASILVFFKEEIEVTVCGVRSKGRSLWKPSNSYNRTNKRRY